MTTPVLQPCVFLDRDGTVTNEAGYINHPLRLKLMSGAAAAIRKLNEAGVLVIIITNQSGIARGYFTEEVLDATHERLHELLRLKGARVDALYFAPNHASAEDPRWRDDPDEMRKPGVGMINMARREFPIDMARSALIGDRMNDILCAHKAGLPGIFVKTGYGLGEWTYERDRWTEQPDYICSSLGQGVNWYFRRVMLKANDKR